MADQGADKSTSKEQSALFSKSEDGGRLRITLRPGAPPLPKRVEDIKELIKKAKLGSYFLFEDEIKKLPELAKKTTEELVVDIGERRDGKFVVEVAKDELEAYLSLTAPYGGVAVSKDQIRAGLRDKGVVFGIRNDVIEAEINKPTGEKRVVAMGKAPEPGDDAKLVSQVSPAGDKRPRLRSDGTVELRELGGFVNVREGDVLMIRVPAKPGVAGTNVMGQVIPARSGANADFAVGLVGAMVDPRDPNRLLATLPGMPRVLENGVWVDQNLDIKDVDLSTGNVYFEGDIQISGDVKVGMRVVASGTVTIGGMVEAGQIEAGGDIIITHGVIGHGEVIQSDGELNPNAALLKARGSVKARFFNNAYIDAGGDVDAAEMIAHSVVLANGQVTVGMENAKKGHIMGGRIRAKDRVYAQVLGSAANVKTHIEVGADPVAAARFDELMLLIQKRGDEIEKLSQLTAQLQDQPRPERPDLPIKIARAREKAQAELTTLAQELETLQKKIQDTLGAQIVVTKKAFSGVQVLVNGKVEVVTNELGPGTFAIREKILTYE